MLVATTAAMFGPIVFFIQRVFGFVEVQIRVLKTSFLCIFSTSCVDCIYFAYFVKLWKLFCWKKHILIELLYLSAAISNYLRFCFNLFACVWVRKNVVRGISFARKCKTGWYYVCFMYTKTFSSFSFKLFVYICIYINLFFFKMNATTFFPLFIRHLLNLLNIIYGNNFWILNIIYE